MYITYKHMYTYLKHTVYTVSAFLHITCIEIVVGGCLSNAYNTTVYIHIAVHYCLHYSLPHRTVGSLAIEKAVRSTGPPLSLEVTPLMEPSK